MQLISEEAVDSAPRVALRKLRLMVVSHSYMEPVPRQKWFVLREIAPEIELLIVTPRFWRERDWSLLKSEPYRGNGLEIVPLPVILDGYLSRHVYVSFLLPRILRRFGPDAILVEAEPWSALYAQMMTLRNFLVPRAKMVFFTWWNTPRRIPFPFSVSHRACLTGTNLVLAGNHGAVDILRGHGYRGPVKVVPQLGVDPRQFRPARPDSELLCKLGVESEFVIGFAGRLTARKGVSTLLQAIAPVSERPWKLILVGDGPESARLKDEARRLGIASRVVFCGLVSREEIQRYMNCMNVLVLPSTREQWEQFGHVLIEAMACGVPVIGSQSGEIPRVIGDAGMIFPIGDPDTLRQQILRLMTDPKLASEYGVKGLRRMQEHYSHEAVARRLREVYVNLCRN